MKITPLLFCVPFLLAPALNAQVVGGGFENKFSLLDPGGGGSFFGTSVASVGDLDGDAVPEFIVGAYFQNTPSGQNGVAYVYSGATQTVLRSHEAVIHADWTGWSVAAVGDMDLDGVPDYAIGHPHYDWSLYGRVTVHSGATGNLIHDWIGSDALGLFGYSVAGAGDLNQDGVPDVLVGAIYGGGGNGSGFAFSGADGTIIHQFHATTGNYLGHAVANAGDVDGDGVDDMLFGAPNANVGGANAAGEAFVYSGATGALIYQYQGADHLDQLGWAVAAVGDLNGDGYGDFAFGMPSSEFAGLPKAGSAFVYSGIDGSELYRLDGEAVDNLFGSAIAAVADLDHDGVPELAVGAPEAEPNGLTSEGAVYLYSGASGTLMNRFDVQTGNANFGSALSAWTDLNGDGYDEFLAGAPEFSGRTVVACGVDSFVDVSSLTVSASKSELLTLELDFPDETAGNDYKVLFSATGRGPFHFGVDIPLTIDDVTVGSYFNDYPFPYMTGGHGVLNSTGEGVAVVGFPAGSMAPYVGLRLYIAAITNEFGRAPNYSSAAIQIRITP